MAPRKKKEEVKASVKAKEPEDVQMSEEEKADATLLEECVEHQSASARWLETVASTWDEKESMLLGMLEDSYSKKSKNKVFDHRLSTIIFERAARVMAQNPKGRAFAVSKNDVGKNALMNLLLKFGITKDILQFSHLLKNRLMDLYSMVYGTMFSLEFWMVNTKTGHIGPQSYVIPIRDVFPQPGIKNVNDMDWFIVRTMMTTQALEGNAKLKRAAEMGWRVDNINRLLTALKTQKFEGDKKQATHESRSYVERNMYPGEQTEKVYPQVETFTEYRYGLWITWASQQVDATTSKPFLIRVAKKTKVFDKMLPICAKHCFPLLDSPIGLGEFERGKTLQYAMNSLINLYLDGVKYSIFPPLAINPDNVVPQSIKWGAGERWFMNSPNQDVQPVNLSPRGIETFNQTYSFMLSAMYNQAGTSEVNQTTKTESGLGKTPQAIRLQAVRESARDEWDRFMMEDYLKEKYRRWVAMYAAFQETEVSIRLFKEEIEELEKTAPDVKDLLTKYDSGRGSISFNKSKLGDEKGNEVDWDYELESGSTVKPNLESDQENLTAILKAVLENPDINRFLAQQNKQVDIGELFKRWIQAGGLKDADKIIVPLQPQSTPKPNVAPQGGQPVSPDQIDPAAAAAAEGAVSPEAVAPPMTDPASATTPQFQDPEITALVSSLMGGAAGIPQRS